MGKYNFVGFEPSDLKQKKIKGLDNGVIEHASGVDPSNNPKDGKLHFPSMVAGGDNPNGFTAQGAFGTARDEREGANSGWNWGQDADGSRWNGTPGEKWKGNRTGE